MWVSTLLIAAVVVLQGHNVDFNTIDHCCCFTGHKMWVSTLLITAVVVLQATMWVSTLLITAIVLQATMWSLNTIEHYCCCFAGHNVGFNTIDYCCCFTGHNVESQHY